MAGSVDESDRGAPTDAEFALADLEHLFRRAVPGSGALLIGGDADSVF